MIKLKKKTAKKRTKKWEQVKKGSHYYAVGDTHTCAMRQE